MTNLAGNRIRRAVAAAVFAAAGAAAAAAEPPRLELAQLSDGFDAERKYMASCFACHSSGAAGAPKVGEGAMEEWAPRLEKGMEAMMANVIGGMGTMPPKGLCFDCTDEDLRAIVDWMIESSGEGPAP